MKKLLASLLIAGSCVALSASQNPLQITRVAFDPPALCPAGATVTVSVTAVGGQPPYTYRAQIGTSTPVVQSSGTFTGLPAATGALTLSVTDSSNPTQSSTVSSNNNAQPFTKALYTLTPPCGGNNNGSISVELSGAEVLNYLLNPGAIPCSENCSGTTATYSGLAAQSYTLIANGNIVCVGGSNQISLGFMLATFKFIPSNNKVANYIAQKYCPCQ